MEKKAKGLARGVKTSSYKPIPRLTAMPEGGLKRHVSAPLAPQLKAGTSGAVPQGQGPLADTPATVKVGSESAAADTSGEPGGNSYSTTNAAPAESFSALRRCSPEYRGRRLGPRRRDRDRVFRDRRRRRQERVVRLDESDAERDRQEPRRGTVFRTNPELRKAASAFPPGCRRPAVSLEGHLEAGTPDVLDELINSAAEGHLSRALTFGSLSTRSEKVKQDQQKAERRHQKDDQRRR